MKLLNPLRIINPLREIFYWSRYTYYTSISKEKLIGDLETLFKTYENRDDKPNVTGAFDSYPNTFRAKPRWFIGIIKSFERDPAYLKGVITESVDGFAKIEVAIRPNTIFPIFAILSIIIAPYWLCLHFTGEGDLNKLYGGLFLLIIGIPLLIGMAKGATYMFKKNFDTYFNPVISKIEKR